MAEAVPVLKANDVALQIFQQIAEQMKEISIDLRDLRERMIRFEAQEYLKKIERLETEITKLEEEIKKDRVEFQKALAKLEKDIEILKTRIAPIFVIATICMTIGGNFLIRALGQ